MAERFECGMPRHFHRSMETRDYCVRRRAAARKNKAQPRPAFRSDRAQGANPTQLSPGEIERLTKALTGAATHAFDRAQRASAVSRGWYNVGQIRDIFERSVVAHADKMLRVARLPATLIDRAKKLEADRSAARRFLAEELKSARGRLKLLNDGISDAEATVQQMVSRLWSQQCPSIRHDDPRGYPLPPAPFVSPSIDGVGLPRASGIYFLWDGETIDYVGQSKVLAARVNLKAHHVLKATHRISYLLVEVHELTWVECYYIGLLRPLKNFGSLASHNRYPAKLTRPPA